MIKCERCDATFKKDKEGIATYQQHRLQHQRGLIASKPAPNSPKEIDIATGKVMLDPITPPIEAPNTPPPPQKPVKQEPTPPTREEKPPKPEKIELKYKFEGQCDHCRGEVDTLVIQTATEKKWIVIAYCHTCKKQLRERPVPKL